MASTVIIVKNKENGSKMVFDTLEEAAKWTGLNVSTLSRACTSMNGCKDWDVRRVTRMYAVAMKDEFPRVWRIAGMNSRISGYLELDTFKKLDGRKVERVKEITLSWYL